MVNRVRPQGEHGQLATFMQILKGEEQWGADSTSCMREREPVSMCFYWGSGDYTNKSARDSLVCFSVSRSQPEDMRNLWQGPTLSHPHLGRMLTAYCELLWGMLRQQEKKNEVLKFTVPLTCGSTSMTTLMGSQNG